MEHKQVKLDCNLQLSDLNFGDLGSYPQDLDQNLIR
jgi:hypothetical protein